MSWELVYILSAIAILPVMIIAIFISIKVTVVIDKYHQYEATGNITAKDLVNKIAAAKHLGIRVETASNNQGDHYDPRDKVVRLTSKVLNSSSVSALAIAAHECGHALQDAENYAPLRLRHMVIRVTNFSSRLLTPLIIISLIASICTLGMMSYQWIYWLMLGFCVVYGLSALVGFITLPTEFNASRRGKVLLQELGYANTPAEKKAVNKVLRAAANTYVVSFALSMLYFLRYLSYFLILTRGRRD